MPGSNNNQTEAEALLTKLNKKSQEQEEHSEGRRKAANTWVAHWIAISQLDLSSCNTVEDVENMLIKSWEEKEKEKDNVVQSILNRK